MNVGNENVDICLYVLGFCLIRNKQNALANIFWRVSKREKCIGLFVGLLVFFLIIYIGPRLSCEKHVSLIYLTTKQIFFHFHLYCMEQFCSITVLSLGQIASHSHIHGKHFISPKANYNYFIKLPVMGLDRQLLVSPELFPEFSCHWEIEGEIRIVRDTKRATWRVFFFFFPPYFCLSLAIKLAKYIQL